MSASVQPLGAAGLEAALAEPLPLLVDFWAPWCGPCRMMAPAFEAAAEALQGQVRFAKVNTDEEPGLATRFAVRAVPTLVLFEGGREVRRISGVLDAGSLLRWLQQAAPAA